MGHIIIGSAALYDGILTRHELQHHHRPVFPNIHAPKNQILTLQDRTNAAWLWTRRHGVVTGVAASALHGAEWVDTGTPIELIWNCTRPPRGLIVRNERLAEDEMTCLSGIPTTSAARTAMDLGRFLARGPALRGSRRFSRSSTAEPLRPRRPGYG